MKKSNKFVAMLAGLMLLLGIGTSLVVAIAPVIDDQLATPTFGAKADTVYEQTLYLDMATEEADAIVQYRLSSTGAWFDYTTPIAITKTTTVYARSFVESEMKVSTEVSATFVVYTEPTVAVLTPEEGEEFTGGNVSATFAVYCANLNNDTLLHVSIMKGSTVLATRYQTNLEALEASIDESAACSVIAELCTSDLSMIEGTKTITHFTVNVPDVETPTISPKTDTTYYSAQKITIATTTEDAAIYYTTDGAVPTADVEDGHSHLYTAPFTISENTTIKAVAVKEGLDNSAVATATYTVDASMKVMITSPDSDLDTSFVTIGYEVYNVALNNDTLVHVKLVASGDTTLVDVYTKEVKPITVNVPVSGPCELMVEVCKADSSLIESLREYTYFAVDLPDVAAPVFSVKADSTYYEAQKLTMSSATKGATIYYTLDGTEPSTDINDGHTHKYNHTPITIDADTIVKAIAVKDYMDKSTLVAAAYTVKHDARVLIKTPVNGSVVASSNIEVTMGLYNAKVNNDTLLHVVVLDFNEYKILLDTVKNNTTAVKATVEKSGLYDVSVALCSAVDSSDYSGTADGAVFTVDLPDAATPVVDVEEGFYYADQQVTLKYGTGGYSSKENPLNIYYTLDGTMPTTDTTDGHTRMIEGPGAKETLDLVLAPGAAYTHYILTAFAVRQYCDNSDTIVKDYTIFATPTISVVEPLADTTIKDDVVDVEFALNNFVVSGAQDGLIKVELGNDVYYLDALTAQLPVQSGNYTMTATLVGADSVAIVPETKVTRAFKVELNGQVPTPTLSVEAGTYYDDIEVEIACDTNAAQIYYTLDGTIPTKESTLYTGAITVTQDTVITAIAFVEDMDNSEVVTAAYTIIHSASVVLTAPEETVTDTTCTIPVDIYNVETLGEHLYKVTLNREVTYYTNDIETSGEIVLNGLATGNYAMRIDIVNAADSTVIENTNGSAIYFTVALPIVATPTFSKDAGAYAAAFKLTLTTATAGATIYYTTDGTVPTDTSNVYSAPIDIDTTIVVNAFAAKKGMDPSEYISAYYEINAAAMENVLCNQGFEEWNETEPLCWAGTETNVPAYEQSTDVHSGNYAIHVNGQGASISDAGQLVNKEKRFSSQPISLDGGKSYEIAVWAKGFAKIRIGLYDVQNAESVTGGYTSWAKEIYLNSTSEYTQIKGVVTAEDTTDAAQIVFGISCYMPSGISDGQKWVYLAQYNSGVLFDDVTVSDADATGIANITPAQTIAVYPNPATQYINVSCTEGADIRVMDLNGRTIKRLAAHDALQRVDVADLAKGMYMISVENAGNRAVAKFIKK